MITTDFIRFNISKSKEKMPAHSSQDNFGSLCKFSTETRTEFNQHSLEELKLDKFYECKKCSLGTNTIISTIKQFKNLETRPNHHRDRSRHVSSSLYLLKNHVQSQHHTKPNFFHCEHSTLESYFCTVCKFTSHTFPQSNQHLTYAKAKSKIRVQRKAYKCQRCYFHTNSILFLVKHQKERCIRCKHKNKTGGLKYNQLSNSDYMEEHNYARNTDRTAVNLDHTYAKSKSEKNQWLRCDKCVYKCKASDTMWQHKHVNQHFSINLIKTV